MSILNAVSGILKHYSCPTECHAHCCKEVGSIDVDEHDYKVLQKISYQKMESKIVNDQKYYEMIVPCKFLNRSDLCSVYESRPEMCRTFPISYFQDSPLIYIFPCMMSKEIYEDLHKFLNHTLTEDNPTYTPEIVTIFSLYLKDFDKEVAIFYGGVQGNMIPSLSTHLVHRFLEYLDVTKAVTNTVSIEYS